MVRARGAAHSVVKNGPLRSELQRPDSSMPDFKTGRRLLLLHQFDVVRQVGNALPDFAFVSLAHVPENRAPYRHIAIAVRTYGRLPAKNAHHSIGRELAGVVLREPSQITGSGFE